MTVPISRHDFLNNLARGGLLLGLAGVGAAALHGAKDPSECINTGYCAACNVHETCTLPERKEVRHG
ncbi:MAG: hypothetical protein KJ052_10220 [Candidatus Hydrogenedentes bacterium]|nr:hypothetical protein [Candidatus Hydrogenedentota bacterium]